MDLLKISQNVRALRIAQGMTVDQLATKSGFSKGFISQVENFRITPSLKAVNKIAAALGTELPVLFQAELDVPEYTFGSLDSGEEVTRNNSGHYGIIYNSLAYRQIERQMDPFIIEYHRTGEEREFLLHDTEEFFVLLSGELDFYIMDENNRTRMKAGDTVYLRANIPHRVRLAENCNYARALNVYTKTADNDPCAQAGNCRK